MPQHKILTDDWSEFESMKKDTERRLFAVENDWELDYLVNKIKTHHSEIDIIKIKTAVKACGRIISVPRPRKVFVECALRKLGIA